MNGIGIWPENIKALNAINSIGENIILADKNYNIVWLNEAAAKLLSHVVLLFGYSSVKELIGTNMDSFHQNPKYQRDVMEKLTETHRARINIRNQFVADIVVTPIKSLSGIIDGYVVMLMDVTTKAEEDERREKLINALSVPMINIWENTLALPLIGEFDKSRADRLIVSVLEQCAQNNIKNVLIDLSGLYEFERETKFELQKLNDCLNLIGTQCILVGITPELAMAAGDLNKNILTFQTAYAGLQYIIKSEQ